MRDSGEGLIIARAGSASIPADEIPSCFVEDELSSPAGGQRTEVFLPPPRAATPVPTAGATVRPTPRPTPEVARITSQAAFPLYALSAPGRELTPTIMRVSTVPAAIGRQVSLFVLQYRVAARRGAIAIVMSTPSTSSTPELNDVDDAIDAIRLDAKLPGTPRSGDPLADPGAALRAVGCPLHQMLKVQIEGVEFPAEVVTWPGLPRVQILRSETGRGELTIEAGLLDRSELLALLPRLVSLQRSPQVAEGLQTYFGSGVLMDASRLPSPTPRRPSSPAPARGR